MTATVRHGLLLVSSALFILRVEAMEAPFDYEATLGHIKPTTSPEIQADTVQGLISRTLPDHSHLFQVTVDPGIALNGRDTFFLKKDAIDSKVHVIGSSGVAAAWGFNHYLKYVCGCQISWETYQQLNLPSTLPDVNISITSQDRFRYYQNVCTLSYSFAWWKWPKWEQHLDWMAMNSINLPLAFIGQEAIWERVYTKMGLNQTEINDHFTGPAFFAWGRMGNIRGWGGPLPMSWHQQTLDLQHKILKRMREFGMTPVLPAFAGHVPQAIVRIYPNINFTAMGSWNSFQDEYCCPYLISPQDNLFQHIGSMFLEEMISEFGSDHIYNCDTFNEMNPGSGEESYLAEVGKATFAAMTNVDPHAIWMMQGWLFLSGFWTESRAKALLTSVPQGRMLVLDLQSELSEMYSRFNSYYGQPFIWCMLHNFGGTLGLYGAAERVNQGVFAGRSFPNSSMIGTGITPEGINQNYVIYDLMLEMSWRQEPAHLDQWFEEYAVRRYGIKNSNTSLAWQLLKDSVYSFDNPKVKIRGKYILCRRPSLKLKPTVWYNASDVIIAWDHLVSASRHLPHSGTLQHDLVDVGRQVLQLLAAHFYAKITTAYRKADLADFREYSMLMVRLLSDLDVLLSSSPDFLLGSWLQDARLWGTNKKEADLYEWNARNQISLWGPRGEILDYANKQWSGVILHYFKPRWELFLKALHSSLQDKVPLNQSNFNELVYDTVEKPFTMDLTSFPHVPQENPVVTSHDIHKRWRRHFKKSVAIAFKKQWLGLHKKKLRSKPQY